MFGFIRTLSKLTRSRIKKRMYGSVIVCLIVLFGLNIYSIGNSIYNPRVNTVANSVDKLNEHAPFLKEIINRLGNSFTYGI